MKIIVGAGALGDAFEKRPGEFQAAFLEYNRSLRPFIEQVQKDALDFGLDTFTSRTEDAIGRGMPGSARQRIVKGRRLAPLA